MINLSVSLTPEAAVEILEKYIVDSAISAEVVDKYTISSDDGKQVSAVVFEKYFMRTSGRASLSVTIENLQGTTNVHAVGAGAGKGTFINFDWGAGDNFESNIEEALQEYIC